MTASSNPIPTVLSLPVGRDPRRRYLGDPKAMLGDHITFTDGFAMRPTKTLYPRPIGGDSARFSSLANTYGADAIPPQCPLPPEDRDYCRAWGGPCEATEDEKDAEND